VSFGTATSNRPVLLALDDEGKFVSVHAMKVYSESGNIVPLILYLNTRLRWVTWTFDTWILSIGGMKTDKENWSTQRRLSLCHFVL
jgi:hypothetical protein